MAIKVDLSKLDTSDWEVSDWADKIKECLKVEVDGLELKVGFDQKKVEKCIRDMCKQVIIAFFDVTNFSDFYAEIGLEGIIIHAPSARNVITVPIEELRFPRPKPNNKLTNGENAELLFQAMRKYFFPEG